MLLLAFGSMVSNEIVMRRSDELRYRDEINRPLQMKYYTNMNLLSLKHNLRTSLSIISMTIQNMIDEREDKYSQSLSQQSLVKKSLTSMNLLNHMKIYAELIEKVVAVTVRTIELIPTIGGAHRRQKNVSNSKNTPLEKNKSDDTKITENQIDKRNHHHYQKFHLYGVISNVTFIIERIKLIVDEMRKLHLESQNTMKNNDEKDETNIKNDDDNDNKIKSGSNFKFKILCRGFNRSIQTEKDNVKVIERTYPQLLLTCAVVSLCHTMRLICGLDEPYVRVSIEFERHGFEEDKNNEENNVDQLDSKINGRVISKTLVGHKYKFGLDVLNRLKFIYNRSGLTQMIESIGGGVNVEIMNGLLKITSWLPYEREIILSNRQSLNQIISRSHSQNKILSEISQRHAPNSSSYYVDTISTNYIDSGVNTEAEVQVSKENENMSTPLRVLLIDDSTLIHEQFINCLKNHNCEIIISINGNMGLDELKNSTTIKLNKNKNGKNDNTSNINNISDDKVNVNKNAISPTVSKSILQIISTGSLNDIDVDNNTQSKEVDNEEENREENKQAPSPSLNCSFDIVFVDLLMPTKSGVEMLQEYHQWAQEQLNPDVLTSNGSFSPGPSSWSPSSTPSSPFSMKVIGKTIFIGLLPLYSTFDEMVGDNENDNNTNASVDNNSDTQDNHNPIDYGFDGILQKPFEMDVIINILQEFRSHLNYFTNSNQSYSIDSLIRSENFSSSSLGSDLKLKPMPSHPYPQFDTKFEFYPLNGLMSYQKNFYEIFSKRFRGTKIHSSG